jgi:hypothetical protein
MQITNRNFFVVFVKLNSPGLYNDMFFSLNINLLIMNDLDLLYKKLKLKM